MGWTTAESFYTIGTLLVRTPTATSDLSPRLCERHSGGWQCTGAVWISATFWTFHRGGTNLSQYNLTTKTTTTLVRIQTPVLLQYWGLAL